MEEKKAQGAKRDNEVLLQRQRPGALTVPYRVIDNPTKLADEDWYVFSPLFGACSHRELGKLSEACVTPYSLKLFLVGSRQYLGN